MGQRRREEDVRKVCGGCCYLFLCFKQKTAYEMLRSRVGSEMGRRDRAEFRPHKLQQGAYVANEGVVAQHSTLVLSHVVDAQRKQCPAHHKQAKAHAANDPRQQ